jgi:hypothetical protein
LSHSTNPRSYPYIVYFLKFEKWQIINSDLKYQSSFSPILDICRPAKSILQKYMHCSMWFNQHVRCTRQSEILPSYKDHPHERWEIKMKLMCWGGDSNGRTSA